MPLSRGIQGELQVFGGGAARHPDHGDSELEALRRQQLRLRAAGRQPDDAEQVRVGADDVKGLGAD